MRLLPTNRRARLWLIWFFVVFGLMNVFGATIDAWRRADDPQGIGWEELRQRQSGVGRVLTTLRDDGDIERYFAYAQATFGRPYPADFVRPAGTAGEEGPPDTVRIVTPPRPLVPWRDFTVEYPPAMMIAALAPALVTGDPDTYFRLFSLEMEAVLTLAVLLAVRTADRLKPGSGSEALAYATALTLALGVVAVRRYDACVALALAAAVNALAARRPGLSGAALGLAIALKGAPLILAPIFMTHAIVRRDWNGLARGLGGGALTLGLAGLTYAGIAGPHALDAFAYHGARPLQIETVCSGLLILARDFDPSLFSKTFTYGSLNVVSPAEPALRALSTALMIAGLLMSWAVAWRRMAAAQDDSERLVAVVFASLACLIAFVTLGKVFSPQYCVWLIPLAATAAPFLKEPARRSLVVSFLLVQAEYPFLYGFLYATLVPATGALILMRTFWRWRFVAQMFGGAPEGAQKAAVRRQAA
jgi:Glycosyltransferase family 87